MSFPQHPAHVFIQQTSMGNPLSVRHCDRQAAEHWPAPTWSYPWSVWVFHALLSQVWFKCFPLREVSLDWHPILD